jgi:hypothetical protein
MTQGGVVMLGEAIDLSEATIEDMIPRNEYAAGVAAALGKDVELDAVELSGATNVSAMVRYWQRKGWGKFGRDEKVATAMGLAQEWAMDPSSIPEGAMTRAKALFGFINARLQRTTSD